jgi:hypothetical protein
VPGSCRCPGRHQGAQLGSASVQRVRGGWASWERSRARAACLGQRRAQQRAGPHAEFLAQPTRHLPPSDQGAGPVTGRGELPHQMGVRSLVQRIKLAAQPGAQRRCGGVAITLGGRGPGCQQLSQLGALLPPGRLGPLLGVPGQQLAVAQRGRSRRITGGGAAATLGDVDRDGRGAQPELGARGDQRVVTSSLTQRPDGGAQVRARGWPGTVRPQMGRHGLAVMRPRAQRKESEQPARQRWQRKLLAVTFRGHSPQQPHLQHGLTLYLPPRLRLCLALTLR